MSIFSIPILKNAGIMAFPRKIRREFSWQ